MPSAVSEQRHGAEFSTRQLVSLSLFLAMATSLHVIEGMIPVPLPFPGVKLGLANIVTLLVLYLYDLRSALTVAVARVLLGSLISGLFLSPSFLLGLSGSVISTLFMGALLKRTVCFSPVGISVAGAVGHNLGQLCMAMLLLQNSAIIYYLPLLLLTAIPTGIVTGTIMHRLLERIRKSDLFRERVGQGEM